MDESDSCPVGQIGVHSHDFDQDGCHDDEDLDDDQDGLSDEDEDIEGSDPFDVDTDDDGVWDGQDAFPTNPEEWKDSDLMVMEIILMHSHTMILNGLIQITTMLEIIPINSQMTQQNGMTPTLTA